MKRKRTSRRTQAGSAEGQQGRTNDTQSRRVRPVTLAVLAICLAVLAVVCYLLWPGAERADEQDSPIAGKPLPAGEPPVDAAAVLQLPVKLPKTVKELNEEVLAVGQVLVRTLPDRPESHVQMAFANLALGREREALQSWKEALARDENFADAHLGMGVILEESGDNEQAIECYRKAIATDPELEQAHRELAEVLLRVGKAEEALEVARECARRFPNIPEHHFWVGQAYLDLGKYEEALEHHQEAIRIDPDFPLSYFPMARACARLGRKEQAAGYRERFAALRKTEMQADQKRSRDYNDLLTQRWAVVKRHVLAGTLHLRHGDLQMAEAHWLRAAAIDPEDTATREALVSLYEKQRRAGAELQFLQELTPLEPDNPDHPLRMGRLLIDMHRWSEAAETLAKLAESQPDSADVQLLLAEAYFMDGSGESAVEHAEEAVRLAPSSRGFLMLAAIRNEHGDRPGALAALKKAMSLDPHNKEIRQTYDQLLAAD